MKKFYIILVMLLGMMATQIEAKTIHWLTFIDTTDKDVGEIDQNTRKILYARWIDLVNATLKEQGYNINPIDVYGSKTSPENCKNIINDLDCDSEDIVVFYYVGHGTENSGTSKFPLMLLAQNYVEKLVPLSWVHETLKKKGARLTITIGMCCNSRQGAPGRIAPTFSANYGNTYIDPSMTECIKKMFLNFRGDLIVTSASPNESSWAVNTLDMGPTDYFTYYWLDQFNNVLPDQSNPDWESMLRGVKQSVYDKVKSDHPGKTQTPIWDNNLIAANRPSVTTPAPPTTPPTTNKNDETTMKTKLDQVLAYISSTNVDRTQRMAMAEKYKPAFASDLIVRIMSQDGDVVVDKEPISTFLGRISTSRLLMNVSSVDFSFNQNGLINSLRVREVYKKK